MRCTHLLLTKAVFHSVVLRGVVPRPTPVPLYLMQRPQPPELANWASFSATVASTPVVHGSFTVFAKFSL